MFKSAKDMLLLAAEMDQSGEQNPIQQEAAYFDGSHSRCVGFKTLGLFVLHPGMRCLVRLASMEDEKSQPRILLCFGSCLMRLFLKQLVSLEQFSTLTS